MTTAERKPSNVCLRHLSIPSSRFRYSHHEFEISSPVPNYENGPTAFKLTMAEHDEDQSGVPLIEGFSESGSQTPPPPAKRKREIEPKAASKKSAKRRKTKKPRDVDDEALDVEMGVNHAIAHMDSNLTADHIAQRTRRFRPELSVVEGEDSYVPGMNVPLEVVDDY